MDILTLTATGLAAEIRAGNLSAVEAAQAALDRIGEKEKEYHCYVTVDREGALARARAVQKKIDAGEWVGPLSGVPVAVKDNLCTGGMATSCGSRILEGFVPPYSAEAVLRLERAGAVVLGKTNMDEFAMGSTTETSYFGPTKNPWDTDRAPGGSSGGSAAAVAAGECFAALGSDTGGSIRQPASLCGVVGLKPTYGTVSRYGLVAYASSMDQVGPLGKNVADCAALLEAIAGRDARDASSLDREDTDFSTALEGEARGLRIGIPRDYFGEGLDGQVRRAVLAAAAKLESAGARMEEFDLGLTQYAVPDYYCIACAEAGSNLSRYDGVKYGYRAADFSGLHDMYRKSRSQGFGPEVKRRIMLGTFVLSEGYYEAYYLKALRVRRLIREAFDRAFAEYDVILGPTSPDAAPKLGESLKDPLKMYLGDIYTVAANLAGLPAISVPCGLNSRGLPIGVQMTADCFGERTLFRAAAAYERLRGPFPGREEDGDDGKK